MALVVRRHFYGDNMRATEFISEEIGTIYESIDDEFRNIVAQQVHVPINKLSKQVAQRLKCWALETLHSYGKGADFEKVGMKTLRAIINDPDRFAKQLIAHATTQGSQ